MVPVDLDLMRKAPQQEEGDGLALSDEVLLFIITRLAGDTADLVRCAATCRRWRRLVSGDAAFICLHAPPRTDRPAARGLALGCFHHPDKGQPPRFVPLPSTSPSRLPSLNHHVDGEGRRIFHTSSRVVACREGRLVVETHRPTTKAGHGALTLCVCNPASGEVDTLPCLRGGDSPGWAYGCALLTIDDLHYCKAPPRSASSYRVVLVFDRDGFTWSRCFCSDAGRWEPAARVTGGRIVGATRRRWPHAAVVHRGVVFWPRLRLVLLALPTVDAMDVPGMSTEKYYRRRFGCLLCSTPDGKLRLAIRDVDSIYVYYQDRDDLTVGSSGNAYIIGGNWWCCYRERREMKLPEVMPELPAPVRWMRLWWLCEQSGLVFFTATSGGQQGTDEEDCCYTLCLDTWKVDKVASNGGKLWKGVYGYEMDRVTLLTSLGGKHRHTSA